MTITKALHRATQKLEYTSSSPGLDAEILCSYALGVKRNEVLLRGSEELSPNAQQVFELLVQQRYDGVPVAYIRGEQEFYGRSFAVNRNVLIPRPETEMLIDIVKKHYPLDTQLRMLDIGTGSGCIAVTLAKEFPNASVVATDIDARALRIAQHNAQHHKATVEFRCGDCYAVCVNDEQFNIILSNPPYLTQETITATTPVAAELRYEPIHALTPLHDSQTSIVEKIITQAPQWLSVEGMLIVEIGEDMGKKALQWARAAFPSRHVEVLKEWSGADRVVAVY